MKKLSIRQKAVNKGVRQIRRQRGASFDQRLASCLYRGPHSRRCVLGASITNAMYHKDMENTCPGFHTESYELDTKINKVMKSLGFETEEDFKFLRDLQKCHDDDAEISDAEFLINFEVKIQDLAKKYNLTIPAVTA
jgi:hypothetical protein